jgi:glucose/arabinose dehydrogenase
MRITVSIFFLFSFLNAASYGIKTLVEEQGVLWGFEFVGDDTIILNFKNGDIKLYDKKDKSVKPVRGFSAEIYDKGQGGLLDVAASPSFESDKTLYFTYVKKLKGGGATTLARAQLVENRLHDFQDLVVTNSVQTDGRHFGSRIAFDNKGYLYFGIGDRGQRNEAQNPKNHFGVILQVDVTNATYKVYSYGHRNPQGLAYDAKNNVLYANEHGPRGGDEINIIKEGANYGWPVVSLGSEYISRLPVGVVKKEGMVDPIYSYTPSIAPSSLMFYDKNKFLEFQGKLFSTALAGQVVSIVDLQGNEERILSGMYERFRHIKADKKGDIYLSTDSGKLFVLEKRE